jgi:adenylosuccinate lyase
MSLSHITALSPLDGRYAAKLSDLRPIMSEHGYMHRRVQVEVTWFIALSDAGFAEFPALSAVPHYLHGLVSNFSEADAAAIKAIEKTTNHDVKAVEYWIKSKFDARPSCKRPPSSCTLPAPAKTSTTPATRCRSASAATPCCCPPWTASSQAARDGPPLRRSAHAQPHPRPDRQPHHRGQGNGQRGDAPAKGRGQHRRREDLAKMNGAVGNYNAHLSAWPDFDWEAFSQKVVETPEPKGLGLTFQPYSIQIEPHDYMAELFDAVARANTILIDLSRDIWGYVSLGYFKQRLKAGEIGSSTMPHKVNPIDFENAEGNLGLANAMLKHLAEKLPISRWQRDLTDSTVLRNIGVAFGYATLAYTSLMTGLNKLELNEERLQPTWTTPGKCWPSPSRP